MSETSPVVTKLDRIDKSELENPDEFIDAEIVDDDNASTADVAHRDGSDVEGWTGPPKFESSHELVRRPRLNVVPLVVSRNLPAVYEQEEVHEGELVPEEAALEKWDKNRDVIDIDEVSPKELAAAPQRPELPPGQSVKELTAAPEKEGLTFVAVDQSVDAERYARDAAERRLDERLNEEGIGMMRKLKRKIWDGTIAKDYLRYKYTQEALKENIAEGSIYAHETDDLSRRQAAEMATIVRFKSDLDEMRHSSGQEQRAENTNPELSAAVKDLVRRGVTENLSDEALQEEATRMLSEFRETHDGELFGKGLVEINNTLEIVRAVRSAIEHGESLDSVLENMRIITGESRSGVRTNPGEHYNRVDNMMEKLASKGVDRLASPEALGAATVIAASVARIGARTVAGLGAKLLLPVGGALLSGTLAAARENKRLKDDYTQHSRQMAQGRAFESGDNKREEMEKYRLDTISVNELTATLESIYGPEADLRGEDALRAALESIAAVETRVIHSDENDQDRIQFNDTLTIEDQRFQLAVARAQAKAAVNQRLESLDPLERTALGLADGATIDSWIDARSSVYLDAFVEEESEKEAAFRKYRYSEALRTGRTAAGWSLAGGAAIQEVAAAIPLFGGSTRAGLIEQAWGVHTQPVNGEVHQTLLERTFNGDTVTASPSEAYVSSSVGEHGTVGVSGGASLDRAVDGTYEIRDQNGSVLVDGLSVDNKGGISAESQAKIERAGLLFEDNSESIQTVTETTRQGTLNDFMKAHSNETTHVKRDLWYDNDTIKFDQNEQRLLNRVDDNGNFVFDVSGMTESGSTHGDQAARVRELAEAGKLKFAVSPSVGSQQEVFMLDAKITTNAQGEEIISAFVPKDSPVAEFARVENGEPVFDGKYAELSQVVSADEDGVTHIRPLATQIGTDAARTSTFDITEKTPRSEMRYDYRITAKPAATPTFTEVPGAFAAVGRQSMGRTRSGEVPSGFVVPPPEAPPALTSRETPRDALRGTDETAVLERVPVGAAVEKVQTPASSPFRPRNQRAVRGFSRPGGSRPQSPRVPGRPGEQVPRSLENPLRKRAEVAAANILSHVNGPRRKPYAKFQVQAMAEARFGRGGYEVFAKPDADGRQIFRIRVTDKGIRHYDANDPSVSR